MSQIIFITGTDTDVGKTVATGVLLHNLRQRGIKALAVKPFCTGSRHDVRIVHELQDGPLSFEQINPWFYRAPLAPMIAARVAQAVSPKLRDVVLHIQSLAKGCDIMLVEGAGGLLTPLAATKPPKWSELPAMVRERCYTAADLIAALNADVLLVARNQLGAINHTLLNIAALPFLEPKRVAIVLMEQRQSDLSAKTNPAVLEELLDPVKVFSVPYLGPNPLGLSALKKNEKILQKSLAKILDSAIFSPLFGRKNRAGKRHKKSFDSLV